MKNAPPLLVDTSGVKFLPISLDSSLLLPLYGSRISAGFPSPAEDYLELRISIGELITSNPTSTFFVQVHGDSMQDAKIYEGDILAVDRSVKAQSGDVVVAKVYNEFTVKRLIIKGQKYYLVPENKKYQPLVITEEMGFEVWGKVVTVLHKL
ncbi:LexA family protein [Adhaeribacter rhizoryzae]|uniref:Translesion error-prone DNA polymerase V autoproteolytic subunit n=1 Tax=Adhaeribacter rhizoryzae TaxID=2607907 RepID=A0A5M6DLE0_9BACT|nr:translesion error-prone DNA polymerase V autoproteolytic subunit [Adhaeribacter rhizoryzae]KAA5548358.1 translesion error-prone DNA polymerase V autoproteolytic subunit [Adhaeribacter rhizoryzae]